MKDVSGLGVERNLFRYRPISEVAIRATADATWQALLRVAIAGIRAGSSLTLSAPSGCPRAVRRVLSDQGIAVFVETDEQWIERIVGRAGRRRRSGGDGIRSSSAADAAGRLAASPSPRCIARSPTAVGGDPDLAVYDNEVTTAGRLELLPFLHEQSITITAHRFGNPDTWSEAVI